MPISQQAKEIQLSKFVLSVSKVFVLIAGLDDVQRAPKMETATKTEEKQNKETMEEEELEEELEGEKDTNVTERDPGVPDNVWDELQRAKQKEAMDEKKRSREIEMDEQ